MVKGMSMDTIYPRDYLENTHLEWFVKISAIIFLYYPILMFLVSRFVEDEVLPHLQFLNRTYKEKNL